DPNKFEKVIIKTDGSSLKHGIWKYYNPLTGSVINTEEYFLDKLKTPDDAAAADTTITPTIMSLKNNTSVKKDSAATKI
ncbi:hypothetical protein ACO1NC_14275, partial [Staphylococcus aureus]